MIIPTYRLLYGASIVVALAAGLIMLILAADPLTLGFDALQARWLGIFSGFLTLVASFLPRVNKAPSNGRTGMD